MDIDESRERYDTGLSKIRHEIKSRLVLHGLFGTVTLADSSEIPGGISVEIRARGKTVARSFDRTQIEGCCLRVGGAVLVGIIAMVAELAPAPAPEATQG